MRVKIKSMDGLAGKSKSTESEFAKFGLKIGDEIEVTKFTGKSVYYQPEPKGDVLFIYTWNIEEEQK